MKIVVYAGCVALCVGLASVSAQGAEPAAKPDLSAVLIGNLLRGMDIDQDGKLGVSEAVQSVEKLAQELDADGNGILSEQELRSGGHKLGAAVQKRADAARHAVRREASKHRADVGDLDQRVEKLGQDIQRHVEQLVGRLSKEIDADLKGLPTPDAARRAASSAIDSAVADARRQVSQQIDQLQARARTVDCPVAERLATAVIDGLDTDQDGEVAQGEIDEIIGNVFGITDSDADGSLNAKEVEGAIQASLDLVTEQARQQLSRSVDRLAHLLRPR